MTPAQISAFVKVINLVIDGSGYVVYAFRRAKRVSLCLPTIYKRGKKMANYELPNDWVLTVPIQTKDAAGDVVPAPAGDTFSVSVSDPASLKGVVGVDENGKPVATFNALVRLASNITVTLSDSAGLEVDTHVFDIVEDTEPTQDFLDFSDATHTIQAVPT